MPKKPSTVWSLELPGKQEPLSRQPAIRGDSVYISQGYRQGDFYESRLSRVHLDSGELQWEHRVPHVAGAPVVGNDGAIYWCRWDGSVLAFSPDGELIWESEVTRHNMRDPVLLSSDALVACECAGQAEHVQLLDCKTGLPRWRVNLWETMECRPNDFVLAQGHVVVLVTFGAFEAREDALIGLRLTDGSLVWREPLPDGGFNPFVWRDAVHFICQGSIQARNPVTGHLVGRIEARTARNPLILGDRAVLCFSDEGDHCVAAYDGGTAPLWAVSAWQQSVPEVVAATPAPVGDALAVLTEKGLVLMLDTASGEMVGRFVHHRGGTDIGGLAYDNGRLCVAQGRHVICYQVT